jgi:hypothetical protein
MGSPSGLKHVAESVMLKTDELYFVVYFCKAFSVLALDPQLIIPLGSGLLGASLIVPLRFQLEPSIHRCAPQGPDGLVWPEIVEEMNNAAMRKRRDADKRDFFLFIEA